MKLLGHSLTEIIENISGDLSKVEQQAYYSTVITASKNKDLSTVYWAFLGSELRFLPKMIPDDIQTLINKMIAGVDRLAAGKEWHEATATLAEVDVAFNKEYVAIASYVLSAISVLKNTADGLRSVDGGAEAVCAADASAYAATFVAYAEAEAAYSKTYANSAADAAHAAYHAAYAEARRRQRAALLEIIESAHG